MTEDYYDEPCIEVRVKLRPSTFKALRRLAAPHPGLTVGGALSVVADTALADRRDPGMPLGKFDHTPQPGRRRGRPPALSPEQVEEAQRMRADGVQWAVIAQRFKVSLWTVKEAVRRAEGKKP